MSKTPPIYGVQSEPINQILQTKTFRFSQIRKENSMAWGRVTNLTGESKRPPDKPPGYDNMKKKKQKSKKNKKRNTAK